MRYSLMTGFACAALVLGLAPAVAQSTMSMPSPAGAGSAPAEAAPEAAAPKPKPKQKGPPGTVTVVNASTKAVRGRHHGGRQDRLALEAARAQGAHSRQAAEDERLHGFRGGDL